MNSTERRQREEAERIARADARAAAEIEDRKLTVRFLDDFRSVTNPLLVELENTGNLQEASTIRKAAADFESVVTGTVPYGHVRTVPTSPPGPLL